MPSTSSAGTPTARPLVAVGPLTNVALMLARHPEARPQRIVLMGGSIGLGNVTPAAEFNIWADPEAAARVFESGLDVTMIGLDVTHQALMTEADAERLRATGRTGTLVAELWAFYNRFHSQTYGFDGSPIHDAVALAHVFRPDLVQTEHRHVEIDCGSELCRGRTVVDLWRRTENEPNAQCRSGNRRPGVHRAPARADRKPRMRKVRRVLAVGGAAAALLGVILARDCSSETVSVALALVGGGLLGVAAGAGAAASRSDTFAAPLVAFFLLFATTIGVMALWLVVAYSNCEPVPLD